MRNPTTADPNLDERIRRKGARKDEDRTDGNRGEDSIAPAASFL
jgi:hypothetical protein